MPLDPNKIALGWPNYVDESTLSGGQWAEQLPLEHLQDARTAVVAKSVSLAVASTQFWMMLPKRRRLHALCLYAHNLSPAATLRVRVYRDTAGTDEIHDTGDVKAWPVTYGLDDVIWGEPNFWNRQLTEEDRKNYTPRAVALFGERLIGSSVHVQVNDPDNPEGHITLGRALLCDIWQPEINVSYGIQHGHDSGTEIKVARDVNRTRYARRVTPKRTASFDLAHLSESEAFLRLHRLQRTQDIVGEILYLYSITPRAENFQRDMVCHQTSLDPLANSFHANFTNGVSLMEIL